MVPHSGVGRGGDAPIVGDKPCSAFLLGDRMHGPIGLTGCMGETSYMPKRLIDLGFLNGGDPTKIKSGR